MTAPTLDWIDESLWQRLTEYRNDLVSRIPIHEDALYNFRRTAEAIGAALAARDGSEAEQQAAARRLVSEMVSRASAERDEDLFDRLLEIMKVEGGDH